MQTSTKIYMWILGVLVALVVGLGIMSGLAGPIDDGYEDNSQSYQDNSNQFSSSSSNDNPFK